MEVAPSRAQNIHYDILREIFEQTQCLPDGRKTLAASARTCRSFQDAALDALWSKLDDLKPLLRLLPLDSEQEDVEDLTGKACDCNEDNENYLCETCCVICAHETLVLKHEISSATWSNFKIYARRVHHLVLREDEQWIHPSLCAAVLEKAGDKRVLPALRSFKWVVDIGSHPGPLSFLPAELRSITIYSEKWSYQGFLRWKTDDILYTINSLCPSLREITIDPQLRILPETLILFDNLRSLTFARSFKTFIYDSNVLGSTASLRALELLDAWLPGGVGHDTFPSGSDVASYKALTTLSLSSESSWCAIASVLCAISSKRLSSLSIRLQGTWNVRALFSNELLMGCRSCNVATSLQLLAKRWSSSIQILILDLRCAHMSDAHVESLPNLLALLYPLRRLERLDIILGDIVEDTSSALQDSDIHTMVNSWPNLQSLRIEVDKAHCNIAVMTLRSLISFVVQLPHLQKLEFPALQLDTHDKSAHTPAEIRDNSSYHFHYFHIHRLLPADASEASIKHAASQLCTAFPKLFVKNFVMGCGKREAQCEWKVLGRAMQLHRDNNPPVI